MQPMGELLANSAINLGLGVGFMALFYGIYRRLGGDSF